ncbi:hypothetical protein ACH47Z_15280 [Streptomyces sp. NPDC020192]|uniref:hypothetical protein n=1 Tax=Streptomyces sp. NPDC020192 TaxID=3365066 RepID=UPI0037998888
MGATDVGGAGAVGREGLDVLGGGVAGGALPGAVVPPLLPGGEPGAAVGELPSSGINDTEPVGVAAVLPLSGPPAAPTAT